MEVRFNRVPDHGALVLLEQLREHATDTLFAGEIGAAEELPLPPVFATEEKHAFAREIVTASTPDFLTADRKSKSEVK